MRNILRIALVGAPLGVAAWAALVASGCGSTGACLGTGGIVDICKPGWTAEECADWDSQNVNGSSWTFHGGQSCESLGYSIECSDGSFAATGGDCG